MGELPFAVAASIVASGVLYYILPHTKVFAPTVAHETHTTCEDKLRQIIDLGKLVDWYRWIVVCLTAARCKNDVLALLAASEFRRNVWR